MKLGWVPRLPLHDLGGPLHDFGGLVGLGPSSTSTNGNGSCSVSRTGTSSLTLVHRLEISGTAFSGSGPGHGQVLLCVLDGLRNTFFDEGLGLVFFSFHFGRIFLMAVLKVVEFWLQEVVLYFWRTKLGFFILCSKLLLKVFLLHNHTFVLLGLGGVERPWASCWRWMFCCSWSTSGCCASFSLHVLLC